MRTTAPSRPRAATGSRGWYGDDGSLRPQSLEQGVSHSRRDHRGNDARDAGGSSTSADDRREAQRLRQRVAHLETTNARLEREIRSLRALASASANEATAVRVDALRHLTAAEDHVQLLHDESQSKLAALHAEMASVGGDAARDAAGEGTGGASTSGPSSGADDTEGRLRDEVASLRGGAGGDGRGGGGARGGVGRGVG